MDDAAISGTEVGCEKSDLHGISGFTMVFSAEKSDESVQEIPAVAALPRNDRREKSLDETLNLLKEISV